MTLRPLLIAIVLLLQQALFAQAGYVDVVYLKNGSMIRGMVIEQVDSGARLCTGLGGLPSAG